MEPEGSAPHSQVPTTCPYPQPAQSSSYPPHPTSWRSILILSSHLSLGLPTGFFPSGFPTKTLYTPLPSPIRATYPTHLILLDFITRKILNDEFRSLSSPFCSFLHSPVTSSLLSQNILLKTLFNTMKKKSSMNLIVLFPVYVYTSESNKSYTFGMRTGFWYLINERALY